MAKVDLSQGSIRRLVMQVAIPMVVAQIVSMLYNIVDRIFIGKIPDIGAVALGGVGIYLPVNITFMAVSLLFGGGGAPQAAIALGAGKRKKAERYMGCCVMPLIITGVLFGIIMFLFGAEILPLFGATKANLTYAVEYVKIISIGIPFSMVITGMNIFINTQGKTFIGMLSVLIGAVMNIVLDAVLILGMNMGVAGAAWATVISQIISAVWVVGFLCSPKSILRIRKENLIPDRKVLGSIVTLGIANFITTGAESLINIILNYFLKKYGATALAGYAMDGATLAISAGTIITTVSSFIRQPINGFCQGLQPIISYNYGAGKHDRVRQAVHFSVFVTTAYAAALWLFIMLMPETFSGIFTDNMDVIGASVPLIRVYVLGMIFSGIQATFTQSFISKGLKKYSVFVSLICKGLYVPLLLILPLLVKPAYSVMAIYGAQAITDVIAVLVMVILYRRTSKM